MMRDPVTVCDAAMQVTAATRRRLLTRAEAYAELRDDEREQACLELADKARIELDVMLDNRLRLMQIYRADYVASL